MDEKPAEAVRSKPDSSLVASCRAIAAGTADAVVSAGNTGAMLAAGLLEIRSAARRRQRPAIAVPIPARDGPSVLLDCGANADARPEHLLQFAHMGAIFAEEILGVARARRCGSSRSARRRRRATSSTLEAHALLAESALDFRGNTEGRDLLAKAADVVVTDGFTGNVALKTMEGTIRTVLEGLRAEIDRRSRREARRPAHPSGRAAACARRLDPDTYGGAYLLGLRGLAVIAHGNSSGTAIANAIRLAARGVEHDVTGRLAARLPRKAETPA